MIESDSRIRMAPTLGAALVFLLIGSLVSNAALAQRVKAGCPRQIQGQPLQEPPVIEALSGVLSTSLVVREHSHNCVPVFVNSRWQWQSMTLRTYFHPPLPGVAIDPDNPATMVPSYPGPTLMMRKPSVATATGDKLNLMLYNRLPNNELPAAECEPALKDWKCEGTDTACNPGANPPAPECASPDQCKGTSFDQISPECFHGADVTNVHYHGSHVSPQEHQDFVLVKVFSSEQIAPPPPQTCSTDPECAVGSYETDMDPLTYEQAPGTHWYHPHKHGSTALQVLNGMAGALLIKGPFDDWLEGNYSFEEKVLVIQQLAEELPFYLPGSAAPRALVNGQANPMIEMAPGEIQRWRLIGATMQGSAALRIGFQGSTSDAPQYRQIAQDGIQFSPENYQLQPFTGQPIVEGAAAREALEENTGFELFPGNRADFLIQAPTTPGHYFMTQKIAANLGERAKAVFERTAREVLDAGSLNLDDPPLLHIYVTNTEPSADTFPTIAAWPELPDYLTTLSNPDVRKTIDFGMTGAAAVLSNCFYVGKDGKKTQYEDGCAFETMTLNRTEEWTVTNDSSPNHPFHIHVNPFQLLEEKGIVGGAFVDNDYSANPIWSDTVALPGTGSVTLATATSSAQCTSGSGNAEVQTCDDFNGTLKWTPPPEDNPEDNPGKCKCSVTQSGHVKLIQKPTDFTGPYVIHCHFLGHEDRGMMQNVQSVCPDTGAGPQYGNPEPGAEPNECRDGNYTAALPDCPGNVICNAEGNSEQR